MKKTTGIIISDKMDKSCVVAITELRRHPIYNKTFKVTGKIMAHDEKNEFKINDKVEITEVKPMSKGKAWKVTGIVK